MFKRMDGFMKWLLKYNDYVVVLANLEIYLINHLARKPHFHESEEEAQQKAPFRKIQDTVMLVYLNFLVLKQIIQIFYYDVTFAKHNQMKLMVQS
mmetsp:Transcript_2756/g.4716  ORF Transcript_2756/g.4716 Transcript_2756/m.4716 type:complete len:95 (+) Transcript_2756:116-400(+)